MSKILVLKLQSNNGTIVNLDHIIHSSQFASGCRPGRSIVSDIGAVVFVADNQAAAVLVPLHKEQPFCQINIRPSRSGDAFPSYDYTWDFIGCKVIRAAFPIPVGRLLGSKTSAVLWTTLDIRALEKGEQEIIRELDQREEQGAQPDYIPEEDSRYADIAEMTGLLKVIRFVYPDDFRIRFSFYH